MSHLRTSSSGDILTIYFLDSKILEGSVIQSIHEELIALLGKTEEPNILLDFRAVKFLSSAALGMLIRAQKKCAEYKANLKLCCLAPSIREVFKITGLEKVLSIYNTSDEAARAFAEKRGIVR